MHAYLKFDQLVTFNQYEKSNKNTIYIWSQEQNKTGKGADFYFE